MSTQNLDKYQRLFVKDAVDRYRGSATVMVGAVHRGHWTVGQAMDVSSELVSETQEHIAWITDPERLGIEPAAHEVAFGPRGLTVGADGKVRRGYGFKTIDPTVAARLQARLSKVTVVTHDEHHLPEWSRVTAVSPPSWLFLRAPDTARADLVMGIKLPADTEPLAGGCVVRTPAHAFAGVSLARLVDTGWVALSDLASALEPAKAHAKALLGARAKGKRLDIHIIVDGAFEGDSEWRPAPSPRAPAEAEDEPRALAEIVSNLNDISADVFERPIHFDSATRHNGQIVVDLRVEGDNTRVSVSWPGAITHKNGLPHDALIAALCDEVNALYAD